MHVGSRLFPYPVLNAVHTNSTYKKDCSFKLYFTKEVVGDLLLLKNVYCTTTSPYLSSLIKEGKAKIYLHFECSQAFLRKTYEISLMPKTITIPCAEVYGPFTISAYVSLCKDIAINKDVNDFVDQYQDVRFRIEKNDIIAVDEGHKDVMRFNEDEDIKKSSIFQVCPDDSYPTGKMTVEPLRDVINIKVAKDVHEKYRELSRSSALEPVFFSLFITPALIQSINSLVSIESTPEEIDELGIDNPWFSSFLNSYRNKYNRDFEAKDLKNLDDIVQNLFGYPCGDAVITIGKIFANQGGKRNDG